VEFELQGALKKYGRMRLRLRLLILSMAVAAVAAPEFLDLSRTDTLICWLGALVVWLFGEIEMRLKTIQIRLAGMDDDLIALRGPEPENNLILELNDW
jgi:hypothetical protein